MSRVRTACFAVFTLSSGVFSSAVLADGDLFGFDNPLGFYIGAGAGLAGVHEGFLDLEDGSFRRFAAQRFGWKVLMGIRPIPQLGVELEYLDLGGAHLAASPAAAGMSQFLGANTAARAGAGFAMGYLPLGSAVDAFGKLGVARLQMPYRYTDAYATSCTGQSSGTSCGTPGELFISQHPVDTGAAYGGGAQVHFNGFAVRAEYERISTGIGDPYLLSLGFTWTP